MEQDRNIDQQIAHRLRQLRAERGWTLADVAERSGVSRATLSRLENAEVSATAGVLGRLCTTYGLTVSRLMHMVENAFRPLVRRADQPVWTDPAGSMHRRSVSPPSDGLSAEAIECRLEPAAEIAYADAPRPGLEHHLLMLEGFLEISVNGTAHQLKEGDCLRYRLDGPSHFSTPAHSGARYVLFLV